MREVIKEGDKVFLKCGGCGEVKEATTDNFYARRGYLLGLSTLCKDCSHKKIMEWRCENKDKYKEYEKTRYLKNKDNITKRVKAWRENNEIKYRDYHNMYRETHKEERNSYNKEYIKGYMKRDYVKDRRKKHTEEKGYSKIHSKTDRLINKLGCRPTSCPICGENTVIVSHHPDYNKYNEIVWCCNSCHRYIHLGKITELKIVDLLA